MPPDNSGQQRSMPRMPRLQRFDRLQIRLLVVVLLAVAALGAAEIGSIQDARWNAINAAEEETANLSHSLADRAESVFVTLDTALLGIRERVETEGLGGVAMPRLQRAMRLWEQSLPMLHRLIVLDAAGHVVAMSGDVPVQEARFAEAAFRHHRDDTGTGMFLGWPVRDLVDTSWVITISRRLTGANGRFSGVVVATVASDFFEKSFAQFDVGKRGVVLLARDDAVLLARWPVASSRINYDLSHGHLFSHIVGPGNQPRFEYPSQFDGRTRLASYYRLPGVPALVMVGRDKADVLAKWNKTAVGHLVAFLFVAAAVGFLGHGLARQIGLSQDTQRLLRASNDQLAASEARTNAANEWLKMAEQVAGVGHWFRSAEGDSRVTWSDEVYRIFGVNRRDFKLTPESAAMLYHPDDRDRIISAFTDAVQAGKPCEIEARLVRPDGSVRHFFSRSLLQFGASGVPDCMFGVTMDVTDRKCHEMALERAQAATEAANRALEAANGALEAMAMQDALTGLANRRYFDRALDEEFRRAMRSDTSLALIMIDVDQFKQFNDLYGHPAGDACLRAIGAVIPNLLNRPGDMAARYGGEEIAVLLPGNTEAEACEMAARIADEIRRLSIPHGGSVHGVVTISAGVEAFAPVHECDLASDLVQQADRALYAAKHAGRDRVYASSHLKLRRRVA